MTGAQADWLRKNPTYRAVGVRPSGARYVNRGMLHEDGTFDAVMPGRNPVVRKGSFEVAILEQK
jgi:hypothetical protein